MAVVHKTVPLLPNHDSLARDPRILVDYSKKVDDLLREVECYLETGLYTELQIIEKVLTLEKEARHNYDGISSSRLLCFILELFKKKNDINSICLYLISFSKKRGQLKRCYVDMVTLAMSWIEEITCKETQMKLIDTLVKITEGKIFLEIEKSRLIRMKARNIEKEGDIVKACLVLQEVPVELFDGMNQAEKTDFIIDQLRLLLSVKDYIRFQIYSKKISPKLLNNPDFMAFKIKYYLYMIEYNKNTQKYADVAANYLQIVNTPSISEEELQEYFSQYVLYLILSPHSSKSLYELEGLQSSYLNYLSKIPFVKMLLNDFLVKKIIKWPLDYEQNIKTLPPFNDEFSEINWALLRTRFIQQNLLVISEYYSRITIQRVAELLGITPNEAEKAVSTLVHEKVIYARIDRLSGIIVLDEPKSYAEILDTFVKDVTNVFDLVEETTHLINNDKMIQYTKNLRSELIDKSL